MTERDTIRSALIDAIGWQEGLADAYAHMPGSKERREALRWAGVYRKLLDKKFGIGTPDDQLAAEVEPVRIWPPENLGSGTMGDERLEHIKREYFPDTPISPEDAAARDVRAVFCEHAAELRKAILASQKEKSREG